MIARERISIGSQMEFISRAIRERGPMEFVELCGSLSRPFIIATFLAVLELLRQRRIDFEQSEPSAPLRLLPFTPSEIHAN